MKWRPGRKVDERAKLRRALDAAPQPVKGIWKSAEDYDRYRDALEDIEAHQQTRGKWSALSHTCATSGR